LPLVTPIVKAAAPAGLNGTHGSTAHYLSRTGASSALLAAAEFKSRFFSGAGPTDVLGTLLPRLDTLITELNSRTASNPPCASQTPVAYTISPFGQSVTLYAQCHEQGTPSFSGDPALVQFGVRDGVTYLYTANGVQWTAAIVTPTPGGTAGQYRVQAWLGLGHGNAGTTMCTTWDGCSYGAMALDADSSTGKFELAVAGIGLGYCGAQLKSDGSNIYAQGSTDMGTSCQPADSLCVAASDATTASTCAAPLTTFDLAALGRISTPSTATLVVGSWGVSLYPASPSLTFNGTASDAIHFGPIAPTPGVGSLSGS